MERRRRRAGYEIPVVRIGWNFLRIGMTMPRVLSMSC